MKWWEESPNDLKATAARHVLERKEIRRIDRSPDMLSVDQAATHAGCSPQTIRAAMREWSRNRGDWPQRGLQWRPGKKRKTGGVAGRRTRGVWVQAWAAGRRLQRGRPKAPGALPALVYECWLDWAMGL